MLNFLQYLIESNSYETLNQVQGDKKRVGVSRCLEQLSYMFCSDVANVADAECTG
jgi:hypothetical protein